MYLRDCLKVNNSIKELYIWFGGFADEIKQEFPKILVHIDTSFLI